METKYLSIDEFIKKLASSEPAPGGGGASGLMAAVGAALAHMVGALTIGKKKYAAVEQDIKELNSKTEGLCARFLQLMDEDEWAFIPLSRAYGMPKDTPEQAAEKERVMEAALRDAANVPLELMELCAEAIGMLSDYEKKGTAIAISDVGVGAAALKAALMGASLNVFINTKSMKDREYADGINAKANGLIEKYAPAADEVFSAVRTRF